MANAKNQHSVDLFTNQLVNLGKYGQNTPTKRCGLSGGRRRKRRTRRRNRRRNQRRNQRGGASYAVDYSLPTKGLPNITRYTDCKVPNNTVDGKPYVPSLIPQKGGGRMTYGDGGRISYGYDKHGAGLANLIKGGYAPIQRTIRPQCAGRRKRTRRRRRRTCSKCPSRCCACCKCRRGKKKSCRCRKCPKKCCPCCRCKRKHRRRKTKKRRKSRRRRQRGGYHQYRANLPDTPGMKLPNSGGYKMANPPTFSVLNNCVDNYNHFKGQGSMSPILDKTVA